MSKAHKKLGRLEPEQQLCVAWRIPGGGWAMDFYNRDERARLDADFELMAPWEYEIDVLDRRPIVERMAYDLWLKESKPEQRALDHWLHAKWFYC